MDKNEISSNISRTAIRREIKKRSEYQVGEMAIFETLSSLDIFFDILISNAEKNLKEENRIRKNMRLPERKTLQNIDIKKSTEELFGKDLTD